MTRQDSPLMLPANAEAEVKTEEENTTIPAPEPAEQRTIEESAVQLSPAPRIDMDGAPQNPFSIAAAAAPMEIKEARRKERLKRATAVLTNDPSESNSEIDAFESEHITEMATPLNDQTAKDKPSDSRVTVVYESLEKPDIYLEPELSGSNNIYFFWFLLVLSLACSIIIYLERTLISQVFRALNNNNFLDLLFRKRNRNNNIIYSSLYILFFINAGLFIYLALGHFQETFGVKVLLYLIAGITMIYLTKHFAVLGVGWIFNIQRVMNAYSFTLIIFNVVLGILLLPINYFVAFGSVHTAKTFVFVGMGLALALYFLRSFRASMMSYPLASKSQFHFAIYLITVELLPIFALWKGGTLM